MPYQKNTRTLAFLTLLVVVCVGLVALWRYTSAPGSGAEQIVSPGIDTPANVLAAHYRRELIAACTITATSSPDNRLRCTELLTDLQELLAPYESYVEREPSVRVGAGVATATVNGVSGVSQ